MRPLILFYILVAYIIIQFVWWSYLLVDLNGDILQQKVEISQLKDPDSTGEEGTLADFNKEFNKKKMMVLGEGFVFLCLLILGIIKIHKSFNKEFALAKQQQNFLLSVSHEFKSPLAAIKLNLETLKKHQLEEDKKNQLINYAVKETDRINTLVGNILLAAQFDSAKFDFDGVTFNLSECLEEIIGDKTILTSENVQINSNIQQDVYMKGDRVSIKSVVLNLIENAIKYSKDAAEIDIDLSSDTKEIVLKVSDLGIGIPVKERNQIFQKFYRMGSELTRKTKGTGLGLYIVKKIVDEHAGKIRISDNYPNGSIFEISIPKNS